MRRSCLTAGLLLTLILVSCDTNNPRVEPEPQPLIPLAVGNEWVGVVHDSLGTVRRTRVRMDTLRVVRDSLVDDEMWYEIKDKFGLSIAWNTHGSNWFTQRKDGLWNRSSPFRPFSDAFLLFPLPEKPGSAHNPKSGISITFIDDDVPYNLDMYGQIHTVEYEIRLSSGYNPEDQDSAHPDERRGLFVFSETVDLPHRFSPSLGPVFLSGIWVRFDQDTEEVVPVGTLSFELLEFIPAPIE